MRCFNSTKKLKRLIYHLCTPFFDLTSSHVTASFRPSDFASTSTTSPVLLPEASFPGPNKNNRLPYPPPSAPPCCLRLCGPVYTAAAVAALASAETHRLPHSLLPCCPRPCLRCRRCHRRRMCDQLRRAQVGISLCARALLIRIPTVMAVVSAPQ